MNRHDRRLAPARWLRARPVLEVSIHDPDNVAWIFNAALRGDLEAQKLAGIITSWAARMIRSPPGEKPLCVCCDSTCHDDPEWSVAIAAPYASEGGRAIVAAICPDCAARDEINDIVARDMANFCGGGYRRPGGAGVTEETAPQEGRS
jgi:hypothetical protein